MVWIQKACKYAPVGSVTCVTDVTRCHRDVSTRDSALSGIQDFYLVKIGKSLQRTILPESPGFVVPRVFLAVRHGAATAYEAVPTRVHTPLPSPKVPGIIAALTRVINL